MAFESDDYQTVQGLVAAGVGVALIPRLALSAVREDIVIRSPFARPARAQRDRRGSRRRAAGAGGDGDAGDPRPGGGAVGRARTRRGRGLSAGLRRRPSARTRLYAPGAPRLATGRPGLTSI